ncbi:MAG: TfoX/Sxy family protein [bacterium]
MSREYCDYLVDLLSPWRPVTAKAMFGGYGLYHRGQIFAIVLEDTLYLKVGDSNRADYEAKGSSPFVYESKNKKISMSYWLLPEEILDDPDALGVWAEKAYQAALQSKKAPRKKAASPRRR